MSLRLLLLASFLVFPSAFAADDCGTNALQNLKNTKAAGDIRTQAGVCLIAHSLGSPDVARTVLHIIRDGKDDLFLREDLIEALSNTPLRHTIQVTEKLGPQIGKEEKENLDRTLASRSASSLMAVAQAVKSMDELVPITRLEGEFFRALNEIAQDDANHVVLRETAVSALEKISQRVVKSGLYEEKTVRSTQETLRVIASRDDISSYYSGAGNAYQRLASAGIPGYMIASKPTVIAPSGRMLSSVPEEKH